MSMSAPAMTTSTTKEHLSDTFSEDLPGDSKVATRDSKPPATSRSQLLSIHKSAPVATSTSGLSRQGYGTIQTSTGRTHVSDDASDNYNNGKRHSEIGHEHGNDGIQKLPFFMISFIVMFIGISSKFHSTVVDQYVYQRFANDIVGNTTHTSSDPCFKGSLDNDSQRKLVKHIQDLASQKILFMDLTEYGLGIPACIVLGMLSRFIGRKLQLFIPMFGYTLKCAGLVVIVYFQADLNWLYLPYAIEGITGNYVGVLLALYLYTSDISGRNRSRTTAMVILEGIKGGTTAALNILVGNLIQHTGFQIPVWISFAAAAFALLLIFVLPNRKPYTLPKVEGQKIRKAQIQDGDISRWKNWFSTFLFPPGTLESAHLRKMFYLALVATFLLLIGALGMKKVQSLYLMDEPICWSSSTIGWFSFGQDLSSNMLTMFIGPLLIRCLPGMIAGVLGMISIAGGCILLALATKGIELYFQPVIGIGQQLPMGVIRGELSRLVGPEAQGPMFAVIAVLESFSFAMGSTFLYVYNLTLGFYKGTVALVGATMLLTGAAILLYFHRIWLRHYGDSKHLQNSVSIPQENDGFSKYP